MSDRDLTRHRFTTSHEWVLLDEGGATVGISDYAQDQLGDVVFVELPAVGTVLAAGDRFGTVESVKTASDLYSPVGGRVSAANDALAEHPEMVNQDAYGDGWMIRLEDVEDREDLLDAAAYRALVGAPE